MRRLRPIACTLVALALALCGLSGCADSEPAASAAPHATDPRPNVVFIVIDTVRRNQLQVFGAERKTTPALSLLADEAVRFDRAFSQAPWTTPSIGSMLSSRYPSDLGISSNESTLPAEAELLPELLQQAGYATGAVVSHTFCGSNWGFDQGFDSFDETQAGGHKTISAPGVTDRAIAFVDAQTQPFFLFAHYFDPHIVYHEHADFRFPRVAGEDSYTGPVRSGMSLQDIRAARIRRPSEDLEELERIYASEIAQTDHHIGRLIEYLRSSGRLDNALVIVTADHGEELLEHGRWGHAKTLYNEVINVPLLIRYPTAEPAVVSDPVGLVDLVPTVLDVVGVAPPALLEGRSLVAAGAPRAVFFETQRRGVDRRGIVLGDYKLVVDQVGATQALYDYVEDPGENRDLSAERQAVAHKLRGLLEKWAAKRRPVTATPSQVELSDDENERLRALGYVDDN